MELVRQQGLQQPQTRLEDELTGYWAQDLWAFGECPLVSDDLRDGKIRVGSDKVIDFRCSLPKIKTELKYACWQKLELKEWSPTTLWTQAVEVRLIIAWLSAKAHPAQSLLDKELQHWELSFRSYLAEVGQLKDRSYKQLRGCKEKVYVQKSRQVIKLRQIYKKVADFYATPTSEYEKDVWDLRHLGVFVNPSVSSYSIIFKDFHIPWFKQAVKQFIKYSLSVHSAGECQNRTATLRRFCRFLVNTRPDIQPEEFNRPLLLDHFSELVESGLQPNTRIRHISQIRTFLELCPREGWANIPDKRMIYSEDFPKQTKAQPRYIPEEVIEQLHEHIDELDTIYARMVLVLQECGMRIGELCRISFNCLLQDAQGDWFLRYYQFKMKKEHSIPITRDIARIIQVQQREVTEEWGENFPYLFPAPKPRGKGGPIRQANFTRALNRLSLDKQIKDQAGECWHFQSHQFRHTVGTRMINLGVPQHIIQRYLGHESPEMTAVYARIHDETLKQEVAKFREKVVNVAGQVVEPNDIEADGDSLQWVKRNIQAQALPNGSCALPIISKGCPHANACLTCTHFRTTAEYLAEHKQQLEQTERLIAKARANGWTRQVEMNEQVKVNLENIIRGLEGSDVDA